MQQNQQEFRQQQQRQGKGQKEQNQSDQSHSSSQDRQKKPIRKSKRIQQNNRYRCDACRRGLPMFSPKIRIYYLCPALGCPRYYCFNHLQDYVNTIDICHPGELLQNFILCQRCRNCWKLYYNELHRCPRRV